MNTKYNLSKDDITEFFEMVFNDYDGVNFSKIEDPERYFTLISKTDWLMYSGPKCKKEIKIKFALIPNIKLGPKC